MDSPRSSLAAAGSGASPENAVLAQFQPPLLLVEPPCPRSGRPRDVPPRQAPPAAGLLRCIDAAAARAEEDGASASTPRTSPACVDCCARPSGAQGPATSSCHQIRPSRFSTFGPWPDVSIAQPLRYSVPVRLIVMLRLLPYWASP